MTTTNLAFSLREQYWLPMGKPAPHRLTRSSSAGVVPEWSEGMTFGAGRVPAGSRSAATWLRQAAFVGQHDELYPVPDPEFHEYPPDVSLHSGLAEVQLVAYLGVGQAAHDQPHDLALPVGEQVKPGGRRHVGDLRARAAEPSSRHEQVTMGHKARCSRRSLSVSGRLGA